MMMAGRKLLTADWRMVVLPVGSAARPEEPAGLESIPAAVPGTAAESLAQAGRFDPAAPTPLQGRDICYSAEVTAQPGRSRLIFDGLATLCEVWWNGACVLETDNMFRRYAVEVEAQAQNTLVLVFRALAGMLARKLPRARWKTMLIDEPALRGIRTTLLGHMPGWCPEIEAVGPWKPVWIEKLEAEAPRLEAIAAHLDEDGTGHLTVSLRKLAETAEAVIHCAGHTAELRQTGPGTFTANLRLPGVAPWWPATHGAPVQHDVVLVQDGVETWLGRTGFRRIEVEHGQDGKGFGLVLNGVPVFARGAVWTSADLLALRDDREACRPHLEAAAAAGFNMIRVPGLGVYASDDLLDLCDELGLMLWQDFQFANFDYPMADEAFAASVEVEVRQALARLRPHPCLTVLCGGSEMQQQAAMMGLPAERRACPLSQDLLPRLAGEDAPGIPFVPNSPSGGSLPFYPGEGIGHYYGVGAYRRSLEDARRANVRFAGECLAFANLPDDAGLAGRKPSDTSWKALAPRDRGADWDFADVRDHYLANLCRIDPQALAAQDPARYLMLSRAASGAVMSETFAEWRRVGSSCRGALVLALNDLAPGCGWGLMAAGGEPKPALQALAHVLRPVQVLALDEGTNGLDVHLLNETPEPRRVKLTLQALRDGHVPVVCGHRELELAARSGQIIPAVDLIGSFFDITYAYRFGPLPHSVTVLRLTDAETGECLSEAFHFPAGRNLPQQDLGLAVAVQQDEDNGWALEIAVDRFAESLHVEDPCFIAQDNWFHLAPAEPRRIRLRRKASAPADAKPSGVVSAVNALAGVRYEG
ncbi:glycosyl hydrolase 2 galactose-binding domain-containing protein [Pannonibacter phragmitetus]|uniref:glycosyl hydrolase 2 galactose-binding domain-containing protein n=1 Tax=Pannonibacter phragmitetus TaxID=121719 RepID=UPI003D2F0846